MVLLACVGVRPVLVHGGGPEINIWLNKLGIEAEFKIGLRVSDGMVPPTLLSATSTGALHALAMLMVHIKHVALDVQHLHCTHTTVSVADHTDHGADMHCFCACNTFLNTHSCKHTLQLRLFLVTIPLSVLWYCGKKPEQGASFAAATMDVVEMVLGGRVNKGLVTLIQQAGGQAVGLCGKDSSIIRARQMVEKDIGFVGDITSISKGLIDDLVHQQYIPVVASVAADPNGQALNVNADIAAGEVGPQTDAVHCIWSARPCMSSLVCNGELAVMCIMHLL